MCILPGWGISQKTGSNPLLWAVFIQRAVFSPRNKTLMKIYNCENHHLMTTELETERSLVPGIKYLFEGCCKLFNRIAKLGKN